MIFSYKKIAGDFLVTTPTKAHLQLQQHANKTHTSEDIETAGGWGVHPAL